jgi:uncharacterized metal-binding protein
MMFPNQDSMCNIELTGHIMMLLPNVVTLLANVKLQGLDVHNPQQTEFNPSVQVTDNAVGVAVGAAVGLLVGVAVGATVGL